MQISIEEYENIGRPQIDILRQSKAPEVKIDDAKVRFTMPPSKQPWGGYMALFADPDGNIFYLDSVEANR